MSPLALVLCACALSAPLLAASLPEPTAIPVQVLQDAAPEDKLNEVSSDEIQRPAADLRNPGPPQRQEHDTQNPEQHQDEQLKVSTIQETIERTHALLKQSFQDVSDNVQSWFANNGDQINVQNHIQKLRDTFTNQIQKLDNTIQSLVSPVAPAVEPQAEESAKKYELIESRLKLLKDNFNNDVETLSAGVELVASLKSRADESVKEESSSTTAAPTQQQNIFAQMMQTFSDNVSNSLSAIQNIITGNRATSPAPPAAGAQADTPAAPAPARPPPLWDSFTNWINNTRPTLPPLPSLPNIFNNNNTDFQNPIQGFINNLQNTQIRPPNFIGNFFGWAGSSTAKPAEAAVAPVQVVENKPQAEAEKPAEVPANPAEATQPVASDNTAAEPQPGPIRQFLNNIPVVQRIQNSITNRDTPRKPAENSDVPRQPAEHSDAPLQPAEHSDAPQKPAENSEMSQQPAENSDTQTKGGFGYGGYGYGGYGAGYGNNNNSGLSKSKPEDVKEPIKEEIKKHKEENPKPEEEKKTE